MQISTRKFLVGPESCTAISNNETYNHAKEKTCNDKSGESQFIVEASFFNGEFSALDYHNILKWFIA